MIKKRKRIGDILTPLTMERLYNVTQDYIDYYMKKRSPEDVVDGVITKKCLCCRSMFRTSEIIHATRLEHITHKHGVPHLTIVARLFIDELMKKARIQFNNNENPKINMPSLKEFIKQVNSSVNDEKFIRKLETSLRQYFSIDYNGFNDIDVSIMSDEFLIECLNMMKNLDTSYGNPVYYSNYLIKEIDEERLERLIKLDADTVFVIKEKINEVNKFL